MNFQVFLIENKQGNYPLRKSPCLVIYKCTKNLKNIQQNTLHPARLNLSKTG